MDRVSIITTFYNASEFLSIALESIAKQKIDLTLFDIEYILVNDCSTDQSLEIVNSFKEKYSNKENFIVNIFDLKENIGCGAARKYGIDQATGNYFMFLDADDYYIHDDFVFRAYTNIKEYKVDIVEYGILFNQMNGKTMNMVNNDRLLIDKGINGVLLMFKQNTIKFNVWSKIYTRKIIESFPYNTSREYEDIRTIPIWVKNANQIIVENTVEINYRAATNSIVRNDGIKTRIGTITAITEMMEYFKDYPEILKMMYGRSMIDICAIMEDKTSNDEGFNEMSKLNTKQLSYIYPNTYKDITFNLEDQN